MSSAPPREWRADALVAALWWVGAVGVAFFLAGGGLTTSSPVDYLYALGRVAGIVAAVLVLNQILLISRVPWIERTLGHDRAAATHSLMGKVAFIAMLAHAALILIMTAHYDGRSVFAAIPAMWDLGWYMVAAQAALGLFTVVVVTSLLIVRRRWRYENWHTVHLLVYIAIILVVPHQFIEGSTFRSMGPAWWFWLVLYVVTVGCWLAFRVAKPLVYARRYAPVVSSVTTHGDGSTSVVVAGRGLGRLGAHPGQFMLWRFLAKGYWREAHPFSLSKAPGDSLRISVGPSGDFSRSLASLPVGTKVLFEGPLGVFTQRSRTRPGAVFVAGGIGVTPLLAMLEEPGGGPIDVILRASSLERAPLRDEVHAAAAARGATVHEFFGPRGEGWSSAAEPATLGGLVAGLGDRDVFICGPVAWADAVEADAVAAGVAPEAIHRERFGW
ncbi:ferredoxin reductase family protein [Demequina sp.]|uniref:ferredoxin reductase family protein n=1 Tax=Demequina sp. TaxID=2050685 RepID=UPI003D0BDFBA